MKKFLLSLLTVMCCTGFASAKDLTFTFAEGSSLNSFTDQGITFTKTKGTAPSWNTKSSVFAWTSGATVKVSSTVGDITAIKINGTKTGDTEANSCKDKFFLGTTKNDPAFTYDSTTGSASFTINPASNEVSIFHNNASGTKQTFIASIVVSIEDGGSTVEPDPVVPELGEILLNNLPISGDVTVAPSEKLTFSCENATSIGYEVAENSDFDLIEASSIEWIAPATAGEYNLTISAFLGESSKVAPVKVTVKAAEVVDPAISITDVIELKNFKKSNGNTPSGTTYTDATYTSANTGITYSAQMAAGNEVMQLRTTNSNSGIVVSANPNGYVAKSIKITWHKETTAGRQLSIYGDNTAFASPSAIYASKDNGNKAQGTEISKETYNANGASVTLTDNYTFLGFRSVSGAQYVSKIEIEWVPAAPAAPNAAIVHVFGSEADAFGESIELKGEPIKVHFKAEEGVKVYHKFVASTAIATFANEADYEGFNEYDGNGLELTEAGTLKHYTEKDGVKSAISEIAVSGSGTTSISEIVAEGAASKVVYDLQGRRVANASKGIFIVGGKKVIRK